MTELRFETFVRHGKALFQSKQYDAAIKSFDAAAKAALKPDLRIDAFDLQLGAMVKVNQLEDAIRLAKSVIRMNRRDPRGYIRAAQIERLFQRPYAAAQWYSHGLKHVSPSHKHYDLLKSGLLKCDPLAASAAVLSNRRDPFASLPVEIARSLLEYFDYREMTAMLRVSKSWRGFLQKEELMTTTVDFSSAKSRVTNTALKAALRRLAQYPKSARLANLTDPATADMKERIPHWLRKNTMVSCHSVIALTDLMLNMLPPAPILTELSMPMSSTNAQAILEKCGHLRHLRCSISTPADPLTLSHEKLEQLHVSPPQYPIVVGAMELPSLRGLDLIRCNIQDVGLAAMFNLKTLRLYNCSIHRSVKLPALIQTLSMVNVIFIGTNPGDLNVPALSHLRSMRADLTAWTLSLQSIVQGSPLLENLDIHDQALSDVSAEVLGSLSSLRDLVLRGAHRMTGVFVKDLLDRTNDRIKSIKLVDCSKVSFDTTDWARQRYNVPVEIGTSDVEWTGKRVFT